MKIIIIGAGIAGLTAAVSLRRAGHSVEILERSAFAAEVGAAINLAPNGTSTLLQLGFDPKRARCVPVPNWDTVNGVTLQRIACQDLTKADDRFGAPFLSVHRVDLHTELLRLAEEGPGGAILRLSSSVIEVNPEKGTVTLADGTIKSADLVVAADGIHSVGRSVVAAVSTAKDTKLSAFRFLLPTETIESDPAGREMLAWKTPGASLLADPNSVALEEERHLMWYSCRNGTVQNFVGIHPTSNATGDHKVQMLQQFGHFHPKIVETLRLAEDVKCWPLFQTDPLSTWTSGKLVLIGDAAHPMLPFGGQGSNQAIEDGSALGLLLTDVHYASQIPGRLRLFEEVRIRRAARVQILSTVRANRENTVEQQIRRYMEDGIILPNTFASRIAHDAGHNISKGCREALHASS